MIVSSLIALTSLLPNALSQAVNVPPDGKHYLGAWLDTVDSRPGANDGDRPVKLNERMGFNMPIFHYAQNIPIDTFPFPVEQVIATNTDAMIMLTVYPRPTPWEVTDVHIRNLTRMCGELNRNGHRVFVRFGPEMNGPWNYYGQQPARYVALWRRVFTAMREDAPFTALIWAPSFGTGYPFGEVGAPRDSEDFRLLDSNGDGTVTNADDAYSPYYPGDDYVDWVGMSVYHYGLRYPWEHNIIPYAGKFEEIINYANFYQNYSVQRNKPFAIAETAGTWFPFTPLGPGDGEVPIKQAWWRQFMTNTTFLRTYPNVKLMAMFEFLKVEETFSNGQDSLRDFRVTVNDSVRTAFLQDFEQVKDWYIFANLTNSSGNGGSGGNGNGGTSRNDAYTTPISLAVLGVSLMASFLLLKL